MKAQSKKFIEEMIASPGYAGQVTAGHKTSITAILLEIAKAYDEATKKVCNVIFDGLPLMKIEFIGA
jgi:hypothetical protein